MDDTSEWLERVTGDPLAGAVRGEVEVLTASEPARRGRYQECRLEVRVTAPDREPVTMAVDAVFPRSRWPRPGMVLPARVSRADPPAVEVDWERMPV
ncbi:MULTISPECIES: hypothetical protein [Microbacterium]|uniref:Uncharacterized protein n=1 Tax=Microbacterium saccharophilum TaxID=1213358 RepID=A0A7Z7CV67_9MICO|nr:MULTISPECIES: hypothetical protein [Microbacterium]SFI17524.1 hypothetical protein SAMN04487751_0094 [Microbacterium saccharophilum]